MQLRRFWEDIYPYHLITHCKDDLAPFLDAENAAFAQQWLLNARKKDDIMLLAYCIMPNHVHICAVPRARDLSTFMNSFKSMTARKMKLGPVWERRFWDSRITTMKELREVVEYIHNNPFKAGMLTNAERYPYSSASSWESLDLHILLEFGPDV